MSSGAVSGSISAGVNQSLARRGAVWGWISAALWIALGLESIVRPEQDNRREIYWWFPYLFMMLTIIAVHRVQRPQHSRVERVSYWIVMIAWIAVLLGNLGLVFNLPALQPLGFPGGAIVAAAGLIVYGVATWKAKVLPWYAGLSFMLWEPGSIATGLLLAPIAPLHERGGYSAGVWKGLAIGVVAYGLHSVSKRPNPAE